MIGDAIEYPIGSTVTNYIVGSLVALLSFLLVPLFFLWGYYIKVLEGTLNGEESPPEFSDIDIGTLFKEGAMYLIISVSYMVVPLFVAAVGIGMAGTALEPEAWGGVTLGFIAVAALLYLGVGYLLPAALMNYVNHRSLGAAFDFGEISSVAVSKPYILTMLVLFISGFVFGGVLTILMLIPVVGWLLYFPATFYFGIFTHRLYGNAYRDAKSDIAT